MTDRPPVKCLMRQPNRSWCGAWTKAENMTTARSEATCLACIAAVERARARILKETTNGQQ